MSGNGRTLTKSSASDKHSDGAAANAGQHAAQCVEKGRGEMTAFEQRQGIERKRRIGCKRAQDTGEQEQTQDFRIDSGG